MFFSYLKKKSISVQSGKSISQLNVFAEMCFMLLFLLQDLSNNIFLNAVKG